MLPTKQFNFTRHQAGFTIVELMVAAAITVVLAGLLIGMTSGVLTAWNKTSGAFSANSQAQMVFDMITEDLQAAIYRRDDNTWLDVGIIREHPEYLRTYRGWRTQASAEPLYSETARWGSRAGIKPMGVEQGFNLEDARFGRAGVWLRFFSSFGSTGPQAISYQMARRPITGPMPIDPLDASNPAEVRYVLIRSVLESATTMNRGFDLAEYNSNLNETTGWPGAFPPAALIRPATTQTIATNVIDFGVRLYVDEGGFLNLYFPADASFDLDGNNFYYRANGEPGRPTINLPPNFRAHFRNGGTAYQGDYPDVIDVFVRILTDEGARQIQNLESGRTPVSAAQFDQRWEEIALEHSRVFTRRIYVNARPF